VWLITIIKDATDELKLVLLLEQYYSFAMMTLYLGTVSVRGLFIFLSDSSVPSPVLDSLNSVYNLYYVFANALVSWRRHFVQLLG